MEAAEAAPHAAAVNSKTAVRKNEFLRGVFPHIYFLIIYYVNIHRYTISLIF